MQGIHEAGHDATVSSEGCSLYHPKNLSRRGSASRYVDKIRIRHKSFTSLLFVTEAIPSRSPACSRSHHDLNSPAKGRTSGSMMSPLLREATEREQRGSGNSALPCSAQIARKIVFLPQPSSSSSLFPILTFFLPPPVNCCRATLLTCPPTFLCIFSISSSASTASASAKSRTSFRPSR